jgi:hypothetical protein
MPVINGTDNPNKLVGKSDVFNPPYNEIYGFGGNDTVEGGFFAFFMARKVIITLGLVA